jgi:hypothetical protein
MPVATNNNNTVGGGTLTEQPAANKPFGPAVFITLLSLTAVSGGILVWSGIDTINNPGVNAVRQACFPTNQPNCQALYQQGLDNQTRTNVLIGVTGGLGLLTFVSVFFTQWSHPKTERAVEPVVGFGTVGLRGRF